MDHIFLSHGSHRPVDDLVYYKGSTEYRNHTFREFAVAKGYPFLLNTPAKTSEKAEDHDVLTSAERLDAFLQEWLFCSFLREVFETIPHQMSIDSMFKHTDFVRRIEMLDGSPQSQQRAMQGVQPVEQGMDNRVPGFETGGYVLCTASLPELAIEWADSIRTNAKEPRLQYKYLSTCIETVHTALKYIGISQPRLQYDPKTISVIATTADLVITMILKAFGNVAASTGTPIDQGSWTLFGWREIYAERMVELGWCRYEAASIYSKFPDLPSIHFCTSMRRHTTHDHHQCTKEACKASIESGVMKHAKACEPAAGNCTAFSVEGDSMSEMLRMIQHDELPVLKMRNCASGLEVSLASRKKQEKYVALSHVWSDGMGNATSNSVFWCQLVALHAKLSKLPHKWVQTDENELLVWIDTLCCPLGADDEKAKVLGQMRQIYAEADFVFVLDSELEAIDIGPMDILEIGFRALHSNWMRRLWTLQEGYLARRLWIQFKNKAFDLDQDAIRKMDVNSLSVEKYCVGRRVKTLYTSLRKKLMEASTDRRIEGTRLMMAIQDRSVTNSSDEPLCVATLLGLEIDQIAAVNEKDNDCGAKRMRTLWTLMEHSALGIPKSVLFHQGEKLALDGFHWAPATFMKQSVLQLAALYSASDAPSARISQRGLCVKSEGILFPSSHLTLPCLQKHKRLSNVNILRSPVMYLRDEKGQWFMFSRQKKSDQSAEFDQSSRSNNVQTEGRGNPVRYGVIFRDNIIDRPPSNFPSGIGLFVGVQGREDQMQLVTSIETVLAVKAIPAQAEVWEIAHQIASKVRKSKDFRMIKRNDALRSMAIDQQPLSTTHDQTVHSALTLLSSERQSFRPMTQEEFVDAKLIEEYALDLTRKHITDDPSCHGTLRRIGADTRLLEATVVAMVAGSAGVDVEFQSSDCIWCVD